MHLSRYLTTFPIHTDPERLLLFSTRTCAVLELSAGLWQTIRAGGQISGTDRAALVEAGILIPDRDAERREMLGTFDRANAAKRPFTAILTLTLDCNLACPYCFEDPFRGQFTMSRETANQLISFLNAKMAAGMDVKVDFYGGEALLALSRLKDIAARLRQAADKHEVSFSFGIITNGTLLTGATVRDLIPLGLESARLTLDGPPDIHNRQRPFVSGASSFDAILGNLMEIGTLLPLELGGNYTRENFRRFPELLDFLLLKGITPDHFTAVAFFPVIPKADGSHSAECTASCATGDEPWMFEAGLYLRAETMKRGFPAPRLKMSACMVEFANDLVVGYDGGLYKCPVFMGDDSLRVGSLAGGIEEYRASHNLDMWKNDECLECPYLPLCFGGCRFLRKLKTGAPDGVDCRKTLYDATLAEIVRQELAL